MSKKRFDDGLQMIQKISQEGSQKVVAALEDISPDLARYTIEFPFGDVLNRPGLDIKSREIATVSALIAMGKIPQLKFHINAAMNVGCNETEIKEIIIQMAVYAGFPSAINAMVAANEVFIQRAEKPEE